MKNLSKFNSFMLFGVFLVAYILFFSYVLIFKNVSPLEVFSSTREYIRHVNMIPFFTINRYLSSSNSIIAASNILGNIILFVPLGTYLQLLKKNKKVWLSILLVFLTTLLVEVIQFVFALGAIDIDDIILNCLGGILGILVYRLLKILRKNEERVHAVLVVMGIIIVLFILLAPILLENAFNFKLRLLRLIL